MDVTGCMSFMAGTMLVIVAAGRILLVCLPFASPIEQLAPVLTLMLRPKARYAAEFFIF